MRTNETNASKKRHAHTATFKAMVINAFEESENVCQDDIAEQFRINQSMVYRWLKDRHTIMKDTASVHRNFSKREENLRNMLNFTNGCGKLSRTHGQEEFQSISIGCGVKLALSKVNLTKSNLSKST